MRRLGVLALVVACGPASKPPAPIKETVVYPPQPVLIESEVDSPYVSVQTPVLHEACATALAKRSPVASGGVSSPKTKIYEFNPIEVRPVRFGPQLRDMPRVYHPPHNPGLMNVERSLRSDVLKACYRWAR